VIDIEKHSSAINYGFIGLHSGRFLLSL